MVSERAERIVLGGLVTPLGLIQAVSEHSQRHGIRAGLAIIKQRFLRAFASAGVRLHEIAGGRHRSTLAPRAVPTMEPHVMGSGLVSEPP